MPGVSPDTVFRTLGFFEELGLVRRLEPLCDRARFDANPARHHHFVCSECGRIEDIVREEIDSYEPPTPVRQFGAVRSVHLRLRGICRTCLSRKEKP